MKAFLGVDVGSVSINLAVINEEMKLISKIYYRTSGQSINALKNVMTNISKDLNGEIEILGVGTTGSGRHLAGIIVGSDIVKNEISAQAMASLHFVPEVKTIIEIGGQDSKLIILNHGIVTDFAMNTVCAAGTGSFLDHQADRLGIPIEEFGNYALKSKKQVRIAGRCTVFAESDMISKQQYGFSTEDIINGLCEGLVRNYINNLGRGKIIKSPYIFQGGVAANLGIKSAFERVLEDEIIIPEHYDVMGAFGVALIAREQYLNNKAASNFRGFNLKDIDFSPSTYECSDCPNTCEIVQVKMNDKIIAIWGDKCGKHATTIG